MQIPDPKFKIGERIALPYLGGKCQETVTVRDMRYWLACDKWQLLVDRNGYEVWMVENAFERF